MWRAMTKRIAILMLIGFAGLASAFSVQERFFAAWWAADAGIPRDGLVAEFLLAVNALDTSGTGDHGTLKDGAAISGGSLVLDGANDYVELSTNIQISASATNLVVSGWLNAASLGRLQTIIGEAALGGARFNVGVGPDNNIRITGRRASSTFTVFASSEINIITTGVWYHIVGMYRADGNHAVYLNGSNVTQTVNDSGVFSSDLAYGRFIGRNNTTNPSYSHGKLSRIRVYRRALTNAEIQSLYNEGPPP